MFDTTYDPYFVSEFHKEYLGLINTFKDLKRPGSFIRYYNINFQQSIKYPDIDSTFDIYNTNGIVFDIYEMTPTYNITPIVSSSAFVMDKKGNMFEGITSILTYSIREPHINDLITFYDPIKSGEIFRVNNLRTAINGVFSEPSITWYEMDLEVAPIKDTGNLKIYKHYIYDIPKEKYYDYVDYSKKMSLISDISAKISQINQYYSPVLDLYMVDNVYIPVIANLAIIYFKNKTLTESNYVRVFDELKKPYGFQSKFPEVPNIINFDSDTFSIYNRELESFEDYEWDRDEESSLNTLLELCKSIYNSINNPIFN